MTTDNFKLEFQIPFSFPYCLAFTHGVFETENLLLADCLTDRRTAGGPTKVILFVDQGVQASRPEIISKIESYFRVHSRTLALSVPCILIPGGEIAKSDQRIFERVVEAIHSAKICRHSYVVVVGGGAVIDAVCFAASVVHRGVRQLRIPTTVLAQADAGIGIKNGVNAYGKKNFLGTFSPPDAVINDSELLSTLDQESWISGIAEAIKVGLIRDREFFLWIKENAVSLRDRDMGKMQLLIKRSAELHLRQISQGGDPFEKGSARPLDFGHWIAHKIEMMSENRLSHGHAVALGIAFDSNYSFRKGFLSYENLASILSCLEEVGFETQDPVLSELDSRTGRLRILEGLDEFREHLGGILTLSLLSDLGQSFEVHEIDEETVSLIAQLAKPPNLG